MRREGVPGLVGRPATELAELVRSGAVTPPAVVRAHLEQVEAVDDQLGAFQRVRWARARAEAEEVAARPDRSVLPLAGVPVAVKDNVPVAGEPMRWGSQATPETPQSEDHEVVRRLRRAGAVVLGITRMPELGAWATTDGPWGIARNPWNPDRTPGGSSGGSAVAVAAGMVPVAQGNDGLGSVRIPAAACGLVGVKPGPGVVPAAIGATSWHGLAENGVMATTVADAALVLSVMGDRPDLRDPRAPERPLRIAVSTASPLPGVRTDLELQAAVRATGRVLAGAGHRVRAADPPYGSRLVRAGTAWWAAAVAEQAEAMAREGHLDPRRLEPRTRRHVTVGRRALAVGLARERDLEWWRRRAEAFLAEFDVLLTPALARPPLRAAEWHRRPWLANVVANAAYAPFAAPWNLAGVPAAVVPAGVHSTGVPLGVQLVGGRGREGTLLALAAQLESLRPWPRHAPVSGLR
ncbi:MAG TPA: amidase [Actinomycetota bacterium]|nr:amidase [Actinomycetota bacterium]